MIRINQLKLSTNHTPEEMRIRIAHTLMVSADAFEYSIVKRSLDARKKPDLYYIYTVDVTCQKEQQLLKRLRKNAQVSFVKPQRYTFPVKHIKHDLPYRPVIVGAGPAGIFCALMLARCGLRPIILERGKAVDQRQQDVEAFWNTGQLVPSSNVQFGEGGAGTFSDGKLNTAIKDPMSRIHYVLSTFVEAGASPEILYDYKPHIGTDELQKILIHLRREIESLGGEYRFSSQLVDIRPCECTSEEKTAYRLVIENPETKQTAEIHSDTVVLCIGHSARDTFEMLLQKGLHLTPKAFAYGVRIQHPQNVINSALYGPGWEQKSLPPASYKLTHKLPDGRGVYSFCMCPGGYVVNASSEEGRLAVNGMSYHDRAGKCANSAIVFTVPVSDFPDDTPLGGMHLQRLLEERAFKAGEGRVPVQTFGDFCQNQPSTDCGSFPPAIRGNYMYGDVRSIFPKQSAEAIEEGILSFNRQIPGFSDKDALLCGVESRTSSPVRIERSDTCQAIGFDGIYPCGEGAGYAGGITSAAVDGIKVAEQILLQVDFPKV